jgi:integrase
MMQILTDPKIRAAKPGATPRKLWAGRGLYLLINPNGSRLWRFKYSRGGREKLMALGSYPGVPLTKARELAAAAKASLRAGGDPMAERQTQRAQTQVAVAATVEALAREWHRKQSPRWSPVHAAAVADRLERLVYPMLGRLHINDVTPPLMLACIRQLEERGARATAHIVRQHMEAVFAYAIAAGIGQLNPAAHIKKALEPVIRDKRPAILSLPGVRDLLRRIEAMPAYPPTKLALRLLALTACRPGEVRGAAWCEFEHLNGTAPLWRIPTQRMKTRVEHVVPLTQQAVAIVEALRPLTGHLELLFPNNRWLDRPMVPNTFLDMLYRCGFKGTHCAHGFRSSFSSIMNERFPHDAAAIEAALAHVVGGTRGAYMRSNYLERRRELMAEWANLLLEGAPPAETLLLGLRR